MAYKSYYVNDKNFLTAIILILFVYFSGKEREQKTKTKDEEMPV